MGKQTFVLLQCCQCHLFQAHIDKQSRRFQCVVCHTKQQYSRVFAKSQGAKDIRALCSEYNARGVAAMEQAKRDQPDCRGGDDSEDHEQDEEQDEEQGGPLDRGLGGAWEEFVEDGEQGQPGTSAPPVRAADSVWEKDSDARRIEAMQDRFRKKPRVRKGEAVSSGRERDRGADRVQGGWSPEATRERGREQGMEQGGKVKGAPGEGPGEGGDALGREKDPAQTSFWHDFLT
jgi:hypothetical protein